MSKLLNCRAVLVYVFAAYTWLSAIDLPAEDCAGSAQKVIACEQIKEAVGKKGIVFLQEDGDLSIQIWAKPSETLAAVAALEQTTRDQLTRIVLQKDVVLDDESAALLTRFTNLQTLYVDRKWSPSVNPILKKLKHLDTIWAQEVGLTGTDLAAIGKVPTIRCLMIADNPIPAGSFGPLAQLPELRQCSLSSMPVSDRDVAAMFGNSPNLRLVYLEKTAVTEAQVNFLLTIYPDAFIAWEPATK